MVIPDLFRHQLGRPGFIFPFPQEQFTQEGVQRFLLGAVLVVACAITWLQGTQEPFEDQHGTFGGVFLGGRCNEDGWMLGPVGGELGER